jgi:uncharacterized protein
MTNSPPLRVSLITLGVADLRRSIAFYEAMGLEPSQAIGNEEVAFIDTGHIVLALFGRQALADDAGLPNTPPGFGGFSLACNVASEDEVTALVQKAERFGGTVLKAPGKAFWGGFTAYFADPDGHPWEVAWNPDFPLHANGRVTLPE